MSTYEDTWKSLGDTNEAASGDKESDHKVVATLATDKDLTPDEQYSVAWGPEAVSTDWIKDKAAKLTEKINKAQSTEVLRNGYKRTNSSATSGDAEKAAAVATSSQAASTSKAPAASTGQSHSASISSRETSDWDGMSDSEKAAWYAEHPNYSALTQLGQDAFGLTSYGKMQDPNFVARQKLIAQGIDPDSSGPYGIKTNATPDDDTPSQATQDAYNYGSNAVTQMQEQSRQDAAAAQQQADDNAQDAISQMESAGQGSGQSAQNNYTQAPSDDGPDQATRDSYNALASQSENYSNEGNNYSSSSSSSSSSSRVICTHFYRKGEINRDVWRADLFFTFAHLSPVTIRGYQFWGIPYVRLMRRSKLAEDIMRPIAKHRAQELAHLMGVVDESGCVVKSSWRGKLVRAVFEPACFVIGLFVGQQDWQSLWTEINTKGA